MSDNGSTAQYIQTHELVGVDLYPTFVRYVPMF
jgi:hypothetical protein